MPPTALEAPARMEPRFSVTAREAAPASEAKLTLPACDLPPLIMEPLALEPRILPLALRPPPAPSF